MTYRTQKRNPNKRLTAHESEPEGVLYASHKSLAYKYVTWQTDLMMSGLRQVACHASQAELRSAS